MHRIYLGDCREVMASMEAESIDAIVSDPPYGLSFMGKEWDHGVPGVAFWVEALRVLKPGGHLLAFGGTRTYHRLAVAIEDAGFEIRDCLQWLYGSGFPKSHNLHDAWHGWGTALKPSWEPIVMARKPLRGTVADNVQAWGTGALNIDGCRIDHNEPAKTKCRTGKNEFFVGTKPSTRLDLAHGRWPANTLFDEEAAAMVDAQSGGASRFFYVAKASPAERDAGLEDGNIHPTVKPIDLMRYLVRMVTPPDGVVLDPFMGSGSTGCAAVLEGFEFVGIDITPEYVEIAERRIAYWGRQPRLI